MTNDVSSSETYGDWYRKYTMYLYNRMMLAYWAGLTSFGDPVLKTEGMLEGYKEILSPSPSIETLNSIEGIAGIHGIPWDHTKFLEYTKAIRDDQDIEYTEQKDYYMLLALCNAIYFVIKDLEKAYQLLNDGKYKKKSGYIIIDGMTNTAIYRDAQPDDIIPSVQQFLNNDFKRWCEQISLNTRGVDELMLLDIENPSMAIIKEGYLKFQNSAIKLRTYVESEINNLNEDEHQMLLNGLFSLKFQLDAISSNTSIKNILLQINENAMQHYVRDEDIIDEETGEVSTVRIFTKNVAYIYENSYIVYHTYFRIAVKELQSLLDSYVRNFKEGGINREDMQQIMQQNNPTLLNDITEIIRKELLKNNINFGEDALTKKSNSLKLLNIDSYTRGKIIQCYKALTLDGMFVIETTDDDFANIFMNDNVGKQAVWIGTLPEINFFISGIKKFLRKEVQDKLWVRTRMCFKPSGIGKTFDRECLKAPGGEVTDKIKKGRLCKAILVLTGKYPEACLKTGDKDSSSVAD